MKIKKFLVKNTLILVLFLMCNYSFAKNKTKDNFKNNKNYKIKSCLSNDSLFSKSSQELITMLGQTIERYAILDYLVGKTTYTFIKLKTEANKLLILENDGGDETLYTIDISKMIIGKNIRLKDWGKKTFSIIFDKTMAQKGEKLKSRRFQIMFENKGKKNLDYDKIKKHIENILNALGRKQQF